MNTNALDTNPLVAGVAVAAGGAVTEGHARSREAYVRAIRRLSRFCGRRKAGKQA